MGLLNELTYVNANFRNAVNDRKRFENQIALYQEQITEWETKIVEETEANKIITDQVNAICTTPGIDHRIQQALNRVLESAQQDVNRYKRGIENNTNTLSDVYDRLAQARLKEKKYEGKEIFIFTKQGLKDTLAHFRHINPKTICLGEDTRGAFVRWRYEGIILTPSENKFFNINFGQPVKVHMPPMVATIHLNGHVTLTAPRNGIKHNGMNNRSVVHPHVLSGNSPCFGDFEGPLQEAINELDFETIATILEMFLSQAAADDPAGKTWYRWLFNTPELDPHHDQDIHTQHYTSTERIIRKNDPTDRSKMFYYIFDEDGSYIRSSFSNLEELYQIQQRVEREQQRLEPDEEINPVGDEANAA